MNKIILRLLIVIVLVVGIGWLVLKFVDFPGDFSSLKDLYNNHIEKFSSVIIENANEISTYENFNVEELTNNKNSYEDIVLKVKTIFENGKTNNFTWQNEKKLKSSMYKVFDEDKQLKDYIITVTAFAKTADPDETTLQSMINLTTERINTVTLSFEKLKVEINSFLIDAKSTND